MLSIELSCSLPNGSVITECIPEDELKTNQCLLVESIIYVFLYEQSLVKADLRVSFIELSEDPNKNSEFRAEITYNRKQPESNDSAIDLQVNYNSIEMVSFSRKYQAIFKKVDFSLRF